MIRQGDCLLIPIAVIPAGAHARKPWEDRYVLLEGEATGHHHSVAALDVDLYERDGVLYVKVKTATPIEHQEHAPLTLRPGFYEMRRQREYWSEENEVRYVVD